MNDAGWSRRKDSGSVGVFCRYFLKFERCSLVR